MRSQRLQPATLQKLRDAIASGRPGIKDEFVSFVETKPTIDQVEEFIRTKSLDDNATLQEALAAIKKPAELKERVRELKEEEIESFKAGLERAQGPQPVSDFADDLKQNAHL